ncbi:hypothetical protein PENTCL1PPCAC_14760, partial [Pristionchus entomophagus]
NSQHFLIIKFLPEMGIAIGCTGILCVGIDRMISVIFSLRYRALNTHLYHLFLAFLIIGFCSFQVFLMVAFYRKRQVVCQVMSSFPDAGQFWFTNGNLLINVLCIMVYSITWIALRSQPDSTIKKHVIKSLFIVAAVDLSGFFITPGLFLLFDYLSLNAQQKFAWTYFCTIFIHIALSVKLLIYYST